MIPLSIQLLRTLQRGSQQLSPEASKLLIAYVGSQRCPEEAFCNRAGQPDLYYTLFGWMLTYALQIPSHASERAAYMAKMEICALDAMHQTVLALCQQLHRIMTVGWIGWRPAVERRLNAFLATYQQHGSQHGVNAWAARLTRQRDERLIRQILSLQHTTGGFLAHAHAPIPDLLTTAVALFALSLYAVAPQTDPMPFITTHWLPDGSFAPTLFDVQSDVEYVFYGLLATGAWERIKKSHRHEAMG